LVDEILVLVLVDEKTLGHIQRFLLIQLEPKHNRLDLFNYSCHSVHMLCWRTRLLTYLPVGETSLKNNQKLVGIY